ncbi:hypothetical protein [Paenibacillus jiagnxiensis]|uniref:hypothetical protein n=1 Tax=Paenibacillus jiagnxiensis TaxID=3228926 RepID=UPI0033A1AC72
MESNYFFNYSNFCVIYIDICFAAFYNLNQIHNAVKKIISLGHKDVFPATAKRPQIVFQGRIAAFFWDSAKEMETKTKGREMKDGEKRIFAIRA